MSPPLSPPAPIPPDVRRAAIEWLLALQSETATDDTRARWQAWLQAHPDHRRAWGRIEAFGHKLRGISSPLAHAALASERPAARRQAIKTLALLVFGGGAVLATAGQTPWRQWTADKRTGVGERASLTLEDGTRIELNTDTALDIDFSATRRLVRLVRGEILVATGHLARAGASLPPFEVQTSQGRIRALGTRFTVRQPDGRGDGATRVAVFEGAVEVRPARADGAWVLSAGQQTRFTRDGLGAVTPASEGSTAWTQGMLVAQDMPLADFLAELDRYRPGHLGCDPAVAQLAVSGTYPLADTDKVLDMLQATLPVRLRSYSRYWITVAARA